ncbi:hypothetical protein [Nocardioides terrisoli]|uniref:hypothetical protein n=1 Tax=Nocardioides terrisoli TaxID=3388267 RepID=UPI00287BB165|nr:hypothetical protein [Nocardioides marmorisolisilvae]
MNSPVDPSTNAPHPSAGSDVLTFGLAPALRARMMGLLLVGLGLVLVIATVVVMATGWSLDVLSALVILVLVAVFAIGHVLVRRWYVVRLDADGYEIRFVRGAGAHRARWVDVLDLSTATVAGARCVVMRLRDGRTTTVPVDVVEGDSEEFVRELGRRLDIGHGYRKRR